MDGPSASGKLTSEELWNVLPSAALALQRDGEATADPTKASHAEVEIGKLIADMLDYKPVNLTRNARWLLVRCGNDYDGLRRLIITKGQDHEFMEWVLDEANVYSLRSVLADEYRKAKATERKLEAEHAKRQRISEKTWERFLEKHPEYNDPQYLEAQLKTAAGTTPPDGEEEPPPEQELK